MILQYFEKKENEYKIIADNIYNSCLNKSKTLINKNYFEEKNFNSSFELISIILVLYIKILNEKNDTKFKKINDELINNLIKDLDKTFREIGIGDMSIGKYVKKYVKKFYFRIKKIDIIFNNFNKNDLIDYLNTLKNINKTYTYMLANDLIEIHGEILNKNLTHKLYVN